jgi:hypothetical protein
MFNLKIFKCFEAFAITTSTTLIQPTPFNSIQFVRMEMDAHQVGCRSFLIPLRTSSHALVGNLMTPRKVHVLDLRWEIKNCPSKMQNIWIMMKSKLVL